MGFLRSLGMVLGVAVSGGAMTAWLTRSIGARGAKIDILQILAAPLTDRPPVVEAYRAAISFSMALSAAVMVAAFLLVFGLRGVPVEPRD
jgi:hypothetical protein